MYQDGEFVALRMLYYDTQAFIHGITFLLYTLLIDPIVTYGSAELFCATIITLSSPYFLITAVIYNRPRGFRRRQRTSY